MANILYRKQKQQKSLDNGATWVDTGEYRVGAILENPSNCQSEDSKQCRWVELDASEGYYCDGIAKYTVQVEECTENGIIWTRTGNQKQGNRVIDSESVDCGYIPTERWVISGDPIVCECGSVIYYEYQELYDDGVWYPTGEKRESEDFATTSGWTCYEETFLDTIDTSNYVLDEIYSYTPQYEYVDALYYNGSFITLERRHISNYRYYDYLQIDSTYYKIADYQTSKNGSTLSYSSYIKILYVYDGYIYMVKTNYNRNNAEHTYTLERFNISTMENEVVLEQYNAYYGYDIIYSKQIEGERNVSSII